MTGLRLTLTSLAAGSLLVFAVAAAGSATTNPTPTPTPAGTLTPTPSAALAGIVPVYSPDEVLVEARPLAASRGVTGWYALLRTEDSDRLSTYRDWLVRSGWAVTVDKAGKLTAHSGRRWLSIAAKPLPGQYAKPGMALGVWYADANEVGP